MKTTGNRQRRFATTATALVLWVFAAGSAQSATCKDELDRFEFRLNSSSLAETDPDTFEALGQQAEDAAELRDEEQCLQTVAALHEVIPADPGAQTNNAAAPAASASRPSAPVLIMAGGGDEPNEPEQVPEGAGSASDEDDRYLDD
jgi:hypothetical protein